MLVTGLAGFDELGLPEMLGERLRLGGGEIPPVLLERAPLPKERARGLSGVLAPAGRPEKADGEAAWLSLTESCSSADSIEAG